MLKKIIKESRPATLVVSLISTSLGIITAYREGYIYKELYWAVWKAFLVTIAGILLQSGVNLINNYFEENVTEEVRKKRNKSFLGYKRSDDEILIFKAGIVCFAITIIIGLYLSCYSGTQLLLIEAIGVFAAYAYAGRPFNYKNYGLGALMSFVMMGPLMVYASFYIFSVRFSLKPILYSFTLGLFIPAILLANELRDYEEDKNGGIGTLTVRIRYKGGKIIYYALIFLAYINTLILILFKAIPVQSVAVLSTFPLIIKINRYMKGERKLLIPITSKIYSLFAVEFLLVLLIFR